MQTLRNHSTQWFEVNICCSILRLNLLHRHKLLAELVEDEKVAIEIARLEEEFRRLMEENRTLVTVHNERAQQLESLCLTNGMRRGSSWPLTSAEPETSRHPADARPWNHAEIKAQLCAPSAQQQSVNQLITQKDAVFICDWVICLSHGRTVIISVCLL